MGKKYPKTDKGQARKILTGDGRKTVGKKRIW